MVGESQPSTEEASSSSSGSVVASDLKKTQNLVLESVRKSIGEAEVVEVLNRRTFAVEADDRRWVVKVVPVGRSWKDRLFLRATLAWEEAVLRSLQSAGPRLAKVPRLLETPHRDTVAMEWVPGEDARSLSVPMRMDVLVEFQTLPVQIRASLVAGFGWWLMHSRGPMFLRHRFWAARRYMGWRGAMRAMVFLSRANLQQSRLGFPFRLHGDPHLGNLRLTPAGELYWLDFESVHPERRWMLDDVVYRAFTWRHVRFKKNKLGLVSEYLRAVDRRLNGELGSGFSMDAVLQFRVALVHRALVELHNAKRDNLEEIAAFLGSVLLDEEAFREWMQAHASGVLATAKELGWAPQTDIAG
jgi:hypothetical protein